MKVLKTQEKQAVGSQIRRILGPAVDEDDITDLLQTGASLDEIMPAAFPFAGIQVL